MDGAGIPVRFQRSLDLISPDPHTVNWNAGCPIAVVVLIDMSFAEDSEWVEYLHDLSQIAERQSIVARFLPVAMQANVLDHLNIREQALRWDDWDSPDEARDQRLIRELAYEFALMLRQQLHSLSLSSTDQPVLARNQEKIQVFLSHTKQDGHGKEIAEAIRCWLHQNSKLSSFLDVYDIPWGADASDTIEYHVERSIFLAIQTDQYSSREWCRREVIQAKQLGVPMILVDCLQTGEERAFPYLGNVPVIRMDPDAMDRIPELASRLLDELVVDYLWRYRIATLPGRPEDTIYMARPPEPASLSAPVIDQEMRSVVVYPDPPLGNEEVQLLQAIRGGLQFQTITQWLAREST